MSPHRKLATKIASAIIDKIESERMLNSDLLIAVIERELAVGLGRPLKEKEPEGFRDLIDAMAAGNVLRYGHAGVILHSDGTVTPVSGDEFYAKTCRHDWNMVSDICRKCGISGLDNYLRSLYA